VCKVRKAGFWPKNRDGPERRREEREELTGPSIKAHADFSGETHGLIFKIVPKFSFTIIRVLPVKVKGFSLMQNGRGGGNVESFDFAQDKRRMANFE
jgi:hypothetical protein